MASSSLSTSLSGDQEKTPFLTERVSDSKTLLVAGAAARQAVLRVSNFEESGELIGSKGKLC